MSFIVCCVLVTVLALVAHKQIKRYSWVFYLIATITCSVGLYFYFFPVQNVVARFLLPIDHKGILATAFLTVVIFIGVLPEGSKYRKKLVPIRAELSIIGSILIISHVISYSALYIAQLLRAAALKSAVEVALILSVVLTIIFVPLAITSINAVRKRMRLATWKRLQKLTYPFLALTYAHIIAFLFPSLLQLSMHAFLTCGAYTVVFGLYTVLRLIRFKKSASSARTIKGESIVQ